MHHFKGIYEAQTLAYTHHDKVNAHLETVRRGLNDARACEAFDPSIFDEPLGWLESHTPIKGIPAFRRALKAGDVQGMEAAFSLIR